MITDIEKLFKQSKHYTEKKWLDVIETDLYPLDWPTAAGGFEWHRIKKLEFVRSLIENGCPLFPENLTLTAPLLITTEKIPLLNILKKNINSAELLVTGDEINLQIGSDLYEIATGVEAGRMMSLAFSPLYHIYELRSTLRQISTIHDYWMHKPDPEISELKIEIEALEILYLRDNIVADLQIGLKYNRHQVRCYAMLFEALGYYALLDPDPLLSDNEHLPFSKQRSHLRQMRTLLGRNQMSQKDQMFKQLLELQ